MGQAARDQNRVTTLLAVSNADGVTPVTLYADPTTHRLLTSSTGGGAPDDATYVTLSVNASLSDERVLTGTANQITITDNGAGSTVVLSLPQSIATSSTPTFASMTLTAASSLTLGTASTNTGAIILKNSTNGNNTTIQAGAAGAALTFTLPTTDGNASDFLQTDGNGVLSWAAGAAGANTALSNLASVAINTALLPDAAAADDFGSATLPFKDIFLAGSSGTPGTNNFRLTGASTSGTRVITLFDATDTVVGKATTDTFTNKTYDTAGTGNSFSINGTAITAVTGTGSVVLATSPSLTTPSLGVASATSINKVAITAPATSATLTIADGKTLTVSDTMTLAGPNGSGNVVFTTSPTLVTPVLGVATATSINKVALTAPATSATLTIADGKTLTASNTMTLAAGADGQTWTFPASSDTVVTLAATQELDNKTLDSSVGKGTWTASGTWTLPAFTAGGVIQLTENAPITYDAASSADGKYSGFVRAGTAGATLAFGDLIYLAAADSRWELADADAASTSGDVLLGMCVLAAASDGDATTVLLQGFIRADAAFPALTISAPAYVSTTAGDIQTTQPSGTDDVIRRVGFAWTADELYFNPSNDYVTHT